MKIGDLDLKCGDCSIIDYCNEYEDTPPCLQPRFRKISVDKYLLAAVKADYTGCQSKDEVVDAIFEEVSKSS